MRILTQAAILKLRKRVWRSTQAVPATLIWIPQKEGGGLKIMKDSEQTEP